MTRNCSAVAFAVGNAAPDKEDHNLVGGAAAVSVGCPH